MLNPFYFDQNNQRRKNAIYAPILDRFILVDDQDIGVTFDTANAISSKIATVVFMIPRETSGMTNQNCLEYSIFDKTGISKEGSNPLIRGQNPNVRLLNSPRQFILSGIPQDPLDNGLSEQLVKLKDWVNYVHRMMNLIHITRYIGLDGDTATFADVFVEPELVANINVTSDDSGIEGGILNAMKRVLYMTDNIEDAERGIADIMSSHENQRVNRMFNRIRKDFFSGT